MSYNDFYRQTLPLANKYYHTIIPTDEEKNILHYQIVDNILRYYRFLHSETINISNYELKQIPKVMTFITQCEKEFELLLPNTVNKLHYPLNISNNENMEPQKDNSLEESIIIAPQTNESVNINGQEIILAEDKTLVVIFKDKKSILEDTIQDTNINKNYNISTNKIKQFTEPNVNFTNTSMYKFNDNKQKKIYNIYNNIKQSIKEELFKERVKHMMLKSEHAAIDGDLFSSAYKKKELS